MQTIEVSNTIYNEIVSRRIGKESLSKTLERELKPVKKCARTAELERLRRQPGSDISVVEKRLASKRLEVNTI
ncbi:hypothetical protein [Methanofollis ethanolicus]|uniref:hypothetical protein n=1 Tax=Methanofollis ethanolicus TaxID=488124 RepID=UPI0009F98C78|nr:hypothetical protein [Methanofollis ethanolicus]